MTERKASIKETGEQLSSDEWARFEKAAAKAKADRTVAKPKIENDESKSEKRKAQGSKR